jgi:Tol biopolymer transport system component
MRQLVGLALALCSAPALAQYGVTTRASVSSTTSDVTGHSGWPSLSNSGRYLAFESKASQIVPGDLNGKYDVFVLDRASAIVKRVSVGLGGIEPNAESRFPSISGDGSRVAFASAATNLVLGDFNGLADVFVVDVATLATQLVSIDAFGVPGNGFSSYPRLSGDGTCVVFESLASNLSPNDLNLDWDVYWHDTTSGVTQLVSRNPAGFSGQGGSGGNAHTGPSVSNDGRWVAFWSTASDLVPNDLNGAVSGPPWCLDCGDDVFVNDVQTGATVRVSVSAAGVEGDNGSVDPSISGDGRFVAFASGASNLVPNDTSGDDVFVHDRDADGDGIFDEPGAISVVRANVTSSGAQSAGIGYGSLNWGGPSISRDGTRVAFMTPVSDLVPLAPNNKYNVYVHDLVSGATDCPTVTPAGVLDSGHSYMPALDAHGRHVAFASDAANLVGNDGNAYADAFVRTLCEPPRSYCTAKVNSLGCTAAIGFTGVPSASLPAPFTISTANLRNQAAGLLLYSLSGPAAVPFQGGHLCLQSPLIRTPLQSTGGSAGAPDCSGALAFDFRAYVDSGVNPALADGVSVFTQFWSRDGGDAFGTNLTDALAFELAAP